MTEHYVGHHARSFLIPHPSTLIPKFAMKQKLAILALLLCGIIYFQNNIPAPDPSGGVTLQQAQQRNGVVPTETGLIADPSGVAALRAARP